MNTTLDFSYLPTLLIKSSVIALLVALFISYLTLPFYVYVHNLKKHKEKNLPIVKFFYKVVKLSYFVFTAFAIASIIFICFMKWQLDQSSNGPSVIRIIAVFVVVLLYILHILQQTFHLLLFSLAIMSYLKYQFPHDFLYSQNYISKYVRNFNVFFVLKDFVCGALYFLYLAQLLGDEIMNITLDFYLVFCIFMNVIICWLTPFIYIPIIIGMRKNRHLHSQQHIYIHEYMFIQSIMVLVLKIITFIYSVLSTSDHYSTMVFVFKVSTVDVITMPLVIQLSYLRCNLNEHSIFASF